ncbi:MULTISPECIES: ArsR/SmtB family transcription factor [unclassified Brevibacterium]|uniref:ArsR/SmtB family transcription factor n=1 Tax=unclassified Brevibacterium TaxID=2614124 RepID=UPI0010931769|nr:winged helix-turn-helix domain-containing protein [Brevibacterium sp. S22]TGD29801.1 ArsR family transcriptional regulator [Brevibacterium sp. S22]
MEQLPAAAERLSALERRVAELEAAAAASVSPQEVGAAQENTDEESAVAAEAPALSDEVGDAPTRDTETFWALHGLIDQLGEEGGVTYTGYTTPPGGTDPVAWQMGLNSAGLAQIDFAEAAGSLAALGHPVRLQLLQAIYEGTSTVAELGKDERFGTSGQIYHHVHALAGAGWLESARRGHWRVPAQRVIPLLTLVLIGTH